jgi:hypothetical protein
VIATEGDLWHDDTCLPLAWKSAERGHFDILKYHDSSFKTPGHFFAPHHHHGNKHQPSALLASIIQMA